MRVTNGTRFINSFVENVRLGDLAVSHVCLGDNQLYPEDTSSMRRLTVELPKEGTLEWAYWAHAIAAVQDLVTPKRYMQLTVGGGRYMVRSSFNALPSVMFESNGVFLFYPDEGASLHSVGPGDSVEVKAVIPVIDDIPLSIRDQDGSGSRSYSLPFLPDTGLYVQWRKGQKRKSAGVNFTLSGSGSGLVHIQGRGQKNGHGRGNTVSDVAWPWFCGVVNGSTRSWLNAFVDGDTGMSLTMRGFNSCNALIGRPRYPAFMKTFLLKILSVA